MPRKVKETRNTLGENAKRTEVPVRSEISLMLDTLTHVLSKHAAC